MIQIHAHLSHLAARVRGGITGFGLASAARVLMVITHNARVKIVDVGPMSVHKLLMFEYLLDSV